MDARFKALTWFGIAVGAVLVSSGIPIWLGALGGVGPCGRYCGAMALALEALDQRRYNLPVGTCLVASGIAFPLAPYFGWTMCQRRRDRSDP